MTLLAKKPILAEFTLGLYSLNLIYLFYLAMLTVNVLLPLDRCSDLELCRCLWRCCSLGVARRVHSASIHTLSRDSSRSVNGNAPAETTTTHEGSLAVIIIVENLVYIDGLVSILEKF